MWHIRGSATRREIMRLAKGARVEKGAREGSGGGVGERVLYTGAVNRCCKDRGGYLPACWLPVSP